MKYFEFMTTEDKIIVRNYSKLWWNRYVSFINSCSINKTSDTYTERHHILPKKLFPSHGNFKLSPYNKIILSARQHYIAHYLFAKASNDMYMWGAWNIMNRHESVKFKSILYDEARKNFAELNKIQLDIEVIKEYFAQGISKSRVAKMLGVDSSVIRRYIREYDLKPTFSYVREFDLGEVKSFIENAEEVYVGTLAKHFKCDHITMSRYLRKNGIELDKREEKYDYGKIIKDLMELYRVYVRVDVFSYLTDMYGSHAMYNTLFQKTNLTFGKNLSKSLTNMTRITLRKIFKLNKLGFHDVHIANEMQLSVHTIREILRYFGKNTINIPKELREKKPLKYGEKEISELRDLLTQGISDRKKLKELTNLPDCIITKTIKEHPINIYLKYNRVITVCPLIMHKKITEGVRGGELSKIFKCDVSVIRQRLGIFDIGYDEDYVFRSTTAVVDWDALRIDYENGMNFKQLYKKYKVYDSTIKRRLRIF